MLFNDLFFGMQLVSGSIFLEFVFLLYFKFSDYTFILFFFAYYFLFQLIFLKRYFWLSVLTAFCTFLLVAYCIEELNFQYSLVKLSESVSRKVTCLIKFLNFFILYYLTTFLTKRFGWGRKLTKRTDIYPISLFIPKEKNGAKSVGKKGTGEDLLCTVFFYGVCHCRGWFMLCRRFDGIRRFCF